MSRRRLAAALLLTGVAALGTGVTEMLLPGSASAAADPGSGLGPVSVTASASGLRMPLYSSSGEDVEGQAPWSTVSMSTGLVTHALTSLFWPGDTGGHGGDTLSLLGAPCIPPNPNGLIPLPVPCVTHAPTPPDSVYQALNDPYKAEAQSGSGQPVVTNDSSGVAMQAVARPAQASAATVLDGSKIPSAGDVFGRVTTSTSVTATGPSSLAVDATSVLHDLSIGGVIKIGSVTSVAHAVTDTVTASGSATTTVAGMTIGGIPVVVDDKGVHVASQSAALPGTSQVNQALAQSGFKIFVAAPAKTVKGASITLDSGSLIVMQSNPQYTSQANDTGRVLVIGGTGIQAGAGKGFDVNGLVAPPVVPPVAPPSTSTGAPSTGPVPTGGSVATGGGVGTPPVVATPQLAAQGIPLSKGIAPGWLVLSLLGAVLAGAGLKRLPDRVLTADGPSCSLDRGTTS